MDVGSDLEKGFETHIYFQTFGGKATKSCPDVMFFFKKKLQFLFAKLNSMNFNF